MDTSHESAPLGLQEFMDKHGAAALRAALAQPAAPIDMVLHCPSCHTQHIDAPEFAEGSPSQTKFAAIEWKWSNPPHRSHLCHHCGTIWRPADVPTNGVATIKTKGKDDRIAQPAAPDAQPVTLADVLDALNLFNRPKPSEDDGPWEAGHFIRVDHLPAFINIIVAAWFGPSAAQAAQLSNLTAVVARCYSEFCGRDYMHLPLDEALRAALAGAAQPAPQPLSDAQAIALWDEYATAPHTCHPAISFSRAVLAAAGITAAPTTDTPKD